MSAKNVPPKQLTEEDRKILRTLVARVARAFYEPKWIVILDALSKVDTYVNVVWSILCCNKLIRCISYRDEQLAKVTKLSPSNVHKICAKLRDESLIRK
jgi:transcription initiation factor TFIIE subunit alpha